MLACCFAQERVAKLTSGVSAAAAANLEQVVWPTPLEEGARSSSSGAASTDGLPGPPMASQSSLDDGPLSRLSSDSLNDAPVDDLDDVNDGPRPHWPRSPPLPFSAPSRCAGAGDFSEDEEVSAPAIAAPETPAGPMSGMSGVSGLSGDMSVRRAPSFLHAGS